MEFSIIILIIFGLIIIITAFYEDTSLGFFAILFLLMIGLSSMHIGFELGIDNTKETVKERLVKDKKIEWKISNDGQPYLILRDSSLVETWKYATDVITEMNTENEILNKD